MNGEFIIITMILAAAMLILLIAKLASFFRRFFEAASSICYQMDHAGSYKEYPSLLGEASLPLSDADSLCK